MTQKEHLPPEASFYPDGDPLWRLREAIDTTGWVSFTQILEAVPEALENPLLLDDLYQRLLKERVAVLPEFSPESEPEPTDTELEDPDAADDWEVPHFMDVLRREIARYPLLTPETEREVAQRIVRGRKAEKRVLNGRLARQERLKLLEQVQDGHQATDTMVLSNLRLVINIAAIYQGNGLDFGDLVNEGNIGLYKAIRKFDPNLGWRFSTYATRWIRQTISRAIQDQARTIRLSGYRILQLNRLKRIEEQLTQEYGRQPTAAELASLFDQTSPKPRKRPINATYIDRLQQFAQHPLSLETPNPSHGIDDELTLDDLVKDPGPTPEAIVIYNAQREAVRMLLDTLPPRDRKILELRFGLNNQVNHTLEEIAAKFGLSCERIRQVESEALKHLRPLAREVGLNEDL